MLFAPEPQHFGGGKTDAIYLDSIKKAYDAGFRAWEDNWLSGKSPALQEKVGELLREKGMTMGVTVVTVGHKARFFRGHSRAGESYPQ